MDGQEDPVARSGEACQPRGIEHTLLLLERVEGAPRAPVPVLSALTLILSPPRASHLAVLGLGLVPAGVGRERRAQSL